MTGWSNNMKEMKCYEVSLKNIRVSQEREYIFAYSINEALKIANKKAYGQNIKSIEVSDVMVTNKID